MSTPSRRAVSTDEPTLREAYRYRAARRAVLSKIVSPRWTEVSAATTLRYYYALKGTYHRRLDAYFATGLCARLRATHGVHFAKTCPMFGLHGNRTGRSCRDPFLCPFCYAREYVIDPFKKMEQFLYGSLAPCDDAGRPLKPKPGWFAVGFRTAQSYIFPSLDDATLAGVAGWVRDTYRKDRQVERIAIGATCGVVLHQMYPVLRRDRFRPRKTPAAQVRFVRCGVLLTRTLPPRLPSQWQATLPANKQNLCTLFGQALAFPTPVMTQPPELVLRFWQHHRRIRKLFWYGPQAPRSQKTVIELEDCHDRR